MNYTKIYNDIIDRARSRVPAGYVERHHVVPRCMGGSDGTDNLEAFQIEGEEYVAKLDYSEGGACDCKCHSPYDPLARDEVFAVHRAPCCGPELQEHINREYRERQLNAPVTELKSC